jgi:hypothetical protein
MLPRNAPIIAFALLKKEVREYGVVKKNVDGILSPAEPKAKRMERGAEL